MSDLIYNASTTVAQFMRSDHPFRILMGPLGTGKTVGGVMEIFRRMSEVPPWDNGIRRSKVIIVRNTMSQLRDTTLATWLNWFPPGDFGVWKPSEMIFHFKLGDIESQIMFRPLDSPDDIRRVLSLEITMAFLNECREIPSSLISDIQGRLRYPSRAQCPDVWKGIVADTNPPEVDSRWQKIIEGQPTEDDEPESVFPAESFIFPSGLSPEAENVENLPIGYYDGLAKGQAQDWINTYIHGMFSPSMSGTPVYRKSFKMDKHISRTHLEVNHSLPLVIGMDFGRTPAASIKQMTQDGRIMTLGEVVTFDMGIETFIKRHLKPFLHTRLQWGGPVVIIGDPSGVKRDDTSELSCFKVLKSEFPRDLGHTVKKASTNDPDTRIRATEQTLTAYPDGEPLHLLDPSCKWLIEGLRSKYRYSHMKNKDHGHKDKPEKNNWSHIVEADQYANLFLMSGKYSAADYVRVGPSNLFNPLGADIFTRHKVPSAGY